MQSSLLFLSLALVSFGGCAAPHKATATASDTKPTRKAVAAANAHSPIQKREIIILLEDSFLSSMPPEGTSPEEVALLLGEPDDTYVSDDELIWNYKDRRVQAIFEKTAAAWVVAAWRSLTLGSHLATD